MNKFYKQISIAFKIWLVALLIDALVGTFFLAASSYSYNVSYALKDLGSYAGISAIFSFPVFMLLFLIINRCMQSKVAGQRTYLIVLLSGIGLTIVAYILFLTYIGVMSKILFVHFLIAIMSCITGIFFQRAAIRKIADASADCF